MIAEKPHFWYAFLNNHTQLSVPIIEIVLAIFSAAIPVVFWYYILRQKKHADKLGRYFLAFTLAAFGAGFFWYARPIITDRLGNGLLPLMAVFLVWGALIEYLKNFTVRIAGLRYIKNIDDIIDLSFAAALGFTFCENAIYFTELFLGKHPQMSADAVTMTKYFLLHALFIPPIHLFCSGIFGYFYGAGLFASDSHREEERNDFWFRIFSLPFLFLPFRYRFRAVKTAQGTFVSALFFGIFFALLQRDPQVSELIAFLQLPALPVDEQLMPLIAFFFFKVGSIVFFLLVDRKKRLEAEGFFLNAK